MCVYGVEARKTFLGNLLGGKSQSDVAQYLCFGFG